MKKFHLLVPILGIFMSFPQIISAYAAVVDDIHYERIPSSYKLLLMSMVFSAMIMFISLFFISAIPELLDDFRGGIFLFMIGMTCNIIGLGLIGSGEDFTSGTIMLYLGHILCMAWVLIIKDRILLEKIPKKKGEKE